MPPSLEVASWAPASLIERLGRRGYVVEWFRNVYVAALRDGVVICEDGRNMWREAPRPGDPGGGDDPGGDPGDGDTPLSCLDNVYNEVCEPELGETYDACPNECPLKP